MPLIHLPLDTAPLGCNAWWGWAGFIEGDGGFQVRFTEPATSPETGKKRKGRISSKFTLHQRQVDPKTGRTYEPLLTTIANLLTCGLYVTHHNNPPVN